MEPPFTPGSDSAAKFKCPECSKAFMNKRSLRQHFDGKHKFKIRKPTK